MQMKQTPQELEKIQAEVSKCLEPAVFSWHTNANIQMLAGYAAIHFTTDGVTDMSFANVWKAVLALKDSLVWTVPPKSKTQKPVLGAEERGLKNHASKDDTYVIPEGKDVIKNARKHALAEASATILMQVVREIESYRGTTHSGTAKGRAILKEMLDKTTRGGPGSVTPDQASQLLDQIKAKAAELYDRPSY